MNSKAVSEAFGAMLTVFLIVAAAGLIYLISYPTIFYGLENIAYRNSVKSMAEIKEIVERMKFGNEISTTKTIQLGGGSVYTMSALNLTVNESLYSIKDLVIDLSGRKIFFESGIFEEVNGRVIPIPISDPNIAITDDTAYFTFYNFGGNFSGGGSELTLNLIYNGTRKMYASEIKIQSKFCTIWAEALNATTGGQQLNLTDTDCSDQTIEAEGNFQIVIVDLEVR